MFRRSMFRVAALLGVALAAALPAYAQDSPTPDVTVAKMIAAGATCTPEGALIACTMVNPTTKVSLTTKFHADGSLDSVVSMEPRTLYAVERLKQRYGPPDSEAAVSTGYAMHWSGVAVNRTAVLTPTVVSITSQVDQSVMQRLARSR